MDYHWLQTNSLEMAERSANGGVVFKRTSTALVLAHELVHAYRHQHNAIVPNTRTEVELKFGKTGMVIRTPREELETTGVRKLENKNVRVITENIIRKEQGLPTESTTGHPERTAVPSSTGRHSRSSR